MVHVCYPFRTCSDWPLTVLVIGIIMHKTCFSSSLERGSKFCNVASLFRKMVKKEFRWHLVPHFSQTFLEPNLLCHVVSVLIQAFVYLSFLLICYNLQGKVSASGGKSPKAAKQSTPVRPLSPRTDNVPSGSKSLKKLKDSPVASHNKNSNATPVSHQSPRKSSGVRSPDFLFGLSPTSFYKASLTPNAFKKFSDDKETKVASSPKQSPGQV